jgi:hypothetical protein
VGRTDDDDALGREQPLEQRKRSVAVHPVQRPADRHDVEAADVGRQRFGLAFDQGEGLRSVLRRLPRSGDHRRLGIDADDAADIGPKAERQTGPRPEIDQRVLSPQPEFLRDAAKESERIGRPQFLIQRNRGGEASHRESGEPLFVERSEIG